MEETEEPTTISGILWANIKRLMLHHWGDITLAKLADKAKIGTGGAGRLKAQKSSSRLSTLAKVAGVWGLQPWQLLVPNLDPANPPHILTKEEREFYARLKRGKELMDGAAQPEAAEAPEAR